MNWRFHSAIAWPGANKKERQSKTAARALIACPVNESNLQGMHSE
jgi:hypothetical protein